MASKNFSDEFRRQAVELYESTAGATVKGIAADLGVERATLRLWLDKLGTGTRTDPDGSRSPRASRAPRSGWSRSPRRSNLSHPGGRRAAMDVTPISGLHSTDSRIVRPKSYPVTMECEPKRLTRG